MLRKRGAAERGHAHHGWLDSRHTFSFAGYHHPEHMGFRVLRVLNDDRVAPGEGFGTHGHRDMEIVSYVLEGALEHKDSMGTGSVLRYGDVQRMTAGRGVTHSEFNSSSIEPVHFLQIWILPERRGLDPAYEERCFSPAEKQGVLRRIVSRGGEGGALSIHQDVAIYASILRSGDQVEHVLNPGRHAWLQVATGAVRVNGVELAEGDGLAVSEEPRVRIEGCGEGEILLFDLP
jgi:redox-sensitive bicupin YhaK (pirin superfamily)